MAVTTTSPPAALVDARTAMEDRIRQGRLRVADDLKTVFPAVWDDPEARLELVYAEYVLRRANGETPDRGDWFRRYPEWHDRLERLFGLYDLLAGDTHRPAATVGPERSTAPQPADDEHPDGYEVLGEVGRGGMAVVYRARHVELNRVVALKVLRWGDWDAADDVRRVRREAELVARMQHPHIVQVYQVGEWDGDPFLALEYVPGGTLADALTRLQRLGQTGVSTAEAVALVGLLAGAVQAAHQQGVIHRDLKPANVLLADDPAGPFASPKVTDFGLAVSTGSSAAVTQTAALAGTPCYMAPEQADACRAAIGPRTDVYALGGILYELLTGRPPFQGATVLETLDLVRHAEPVSPRLFRPNLPRDLETICLKCLEKDPVRRYESAQALADDLARFRDGRPITARPVRTLEKAWKWCRRRPWIAGLAAGLVLAITLGVAGVTREYLRAEDERAKAVVAAENERQARVTAQEKELLALASATEARKAKTQNAERLRQIELINNTVLDVFADFDITEARADGKPTEYVLARRLIEAGKTLDERAIDDPVMLATLRGRLGKTLLGLGEAGAAIDLFTAALAVYEERTGREGRVTLLIMNNLAAAYLNAGRFKLAIPLLQETLKRCQAVLGNDDPHTLAVLTNLAAAHKDAGQYDLALPLLAKAYEWNKALFGPDAPSTLTGMTFLAEGYMAAGKFDLALNLCKTVLERRTTILGPDDRFTLSSATHLAACHQAVGRFDRALSLLEDALLRMTARFGSDHPLTLSALKYKAAALLDSQALDQAIPLLESTLKLREVKLGRDHPHTLQSLDMLAMGYLLDDKPQRAISLFEEVLKRREAMFDADHPDTLKSLNNLGEAHRMAGHHDLAFKFLEKAVARHEATLGPDHPGTLTSIHNLGSAHYSQGRPEKALPLLEKAQAGREKTLGANHPDTLKSINNVAEAHRANGRPDLALPLFKRAVDGRSTQLAPDHPDNLTSLNNLAACYWKLGKLDQSVPLFEKLLPAREKQRGRGHPDTQLAVANLGVNYKDAGRLDDALPLLEEAHRASAKIPTLRWVAAQLVDGCARAGKKVEAVKVLPDALADARRKYSADSPQLANALGHLGTALVRVGAFVEAEPLLRECLVIREKKQPDHWTTANARSLVGGALAGQKKYADAEPLLISGYEGLKSRERDMPKSGGAELYIPAALDRLVALYTATDKSDEAKKYQELRAAYPKPKGKK